MTIEKLASATILSIGKDLLQIHSFLKENRSTLICNDNWNLKGYNLNYREYKVPDIYAVVAKDKFIYLNYLFINRILSFGRINLNFQRNSFGSLVKYFDAHFRNIEEDYWQTPDSSVKIRIKYSDQFTESEIQYYKLEFILHELSPDLQNQGIVIH